MKFYFPPALSFYFCVKPYCHFSAKSLPKISTGPRFQPLSASIRTDVMAVIMITSTENWCLEKITVYWHLF